KPAAPVDAGVPDAAAVVAVAVDAATEVPADAAVEGAAIEVTGKAAELLAPGETTWTKLPEGAGTLAKGSSVRLGPRTTAKVTAGSVAVALGGGARVKLGDDMAIAPAPPARRRPSGCQAGRSRSPAPRAAPRRPSSTAAPARPGSR